MNTLPTAGPNMSVSILFVMALKLPETRNLLRENREALAEAEKHIPKVSLLRALAESDAPTEEVIASLPEETRRELAEGVDIHSGLDTAELNHDLAVPALRALFDQVLFHRLAALHRDLAKEGMDEDEMRRVLAEITAVKDELKSSGAMQRFTSSHLKMIPDRPRLDLPPDDPIRQHFDNDPKAHGWVEQVTPEGWKLFGTHNHRLAIEQLQKMAPEILKREMHPTNATFQLLEMLHDTEDIAMVLVALWIPPDGDDPERLESGWALQILKGTKADAGRMKARADELARSALNL